MVDRAQVKINKRYQRSGKVWPLNAKSYLVETVILGFALPRLMLHQRPATTKAPEYTDVVDGQQRTTALRAFRAGEFKLSPAVDREDLRGKRYNTLSARDRSAFDNYVLKMDRFEGATEEDIREVFRRINSYTVPLNPAEQRHAKFQGEFKWFVHRQLDVFGPVLTSSGVLSQKQVDRMADAKLLTEILHAMVNGITTTNAKTLRKLYSDFDPEFELEADFGGRLKRAQEVFASLGRLPKPLAKHYHAYSLVLAILHAAEHLPSLTSTIRRTRPFRAVEKIKDNLESLASILRLPEDDVPSQYTDFVASSASGTNVRAARIVRFKWFFRALTERSL
jgi:hypothetical protein